MKTRSWRSKAGRLNLSTAGLLLLLAVVFMLPGLPPGRTPASMDWLLSSYPPWIGYHPDTNPRFTGGDLVLQQLPWRHWMQNELSAGRFPLWDSSQVGGMSLFANINPGVLSPLHLLWVLMPVGAGLGITMVLKLWLMGLGMWFFLASWLPAISEQVSDDEVCSGRLNFAGGAQR